MRQRKLNHYIILGIVAVLIYSILLYIGTAYLQRELALSLQKSTDAKEVNIELRPELPFGLLTGSFSMVRLVLKEANLGVMGSEIVVFNAAKVDVSTLQLLRKGTLTVNTVDEASARLDLSEENINDYFDTLSLPQDLIKTEITQDSFQLSGDLPLAGRELQVSLYGNLKVLPENNLQIVPEKLVIENAEMPPILMERLLADYLILPINLDSLPVSLSITEVRLQEGLVSIFAH